VILKSLTEVWYLNSLTEVWYWNREIYHKNILKSGIVGESCVIVCVCVVSISFWPKWLGSTMAGRRYWLVLWIILQKFVWFYLVSFVFSICWQRLVSATFANEFIWNKYYISWNKVAVAVASSNYAHSDSRKPFKGLANSLLLRS